MLVLYLYLFVCVRSFLGLFWCDNLENKTNLKNKINPNYGEALKIQDGPKMEKITSEMKMKITLNIKRDPKM